MKKIGCYIAFIILAINMVYGQDVMKMGDREMAQENYAKAAYLYAQYFYAVKSEQQKNAVYYPYGLHHSHESTENHSKEEFTPPEKLEGKSAIIAAHKLANAFRLAHDYKHAEQWYALASKYSSSDFPKTLYYYGVSLQENKKYKAAENVFENVANKISNKSDKFYDIVHNKLSSCQFALRTNKEKEGNKGEKVQLLNTRINSGATSFGMMFSSQGILFSSTQKTIISKQDRSDSLNFNSNLYLTNKIEDKNDFTPPKLFKGNANSYAIEGGAVLLFGGKTILFTRVDPHNRKNVHIYLTRMFQGHWTAPYKLNEAFNVDGYKSMTPCVLKEGESKVSVFYASNRPGGQGGLDIWQTSINQFGETTPPVNLGKKINTPEDEMSPYYDRNSKTLYFASKGHIGYGGYDIYKSNWDKIYKTWSVVKNMGNTINSSRDDAYFVWNSEKNSGYLSSDKKKCESCNSNKIIIPHCFKIYGVTTPAPTQVVVNGYVYNQETNRPIGGVVIQFKDIRGKLQNETALTDAKGHYSYTIRSNKEFFVKASREGYFADAHIIKTLGVNKKTIITQNFKIKLIPNTEIEIPGIEYDLNSSYLRDKSKDILDSLVQFLKLNDNLTVQIRSHTDINGKDKYNVWLSQKRAQRVVDYLIEKGIKASRLSAKGYGSTLPKTLMINGKETVLDSNFIDSLPSKEEKEKYNQLNRRTTFKVLKDQ